MTGLLTALALLATLTTGDPMRPQGQPGYDVASTSSSADVLLDGSSAAWDDVASIAWGPEPYPTAFQALWSSEALFVRFAAVDDAPWYTLTRRDDPLWDEEVVEIFLDPDRSGTHYAEVEVSPANVVCDVRMVRPSPDKEMDLAWNLEGLETRVQRLDVAGRPAWVVTAQMPWSGFRSLPSAAHIALPPAPGDRWRFNVFRIKRPWGPRAPTRDVVFAAWSEPSGSSFHEPAVFRDLTFVR